MPNYCDYQMKIVGAKEDCQAFVRRLESYTEPNHFWRIFQADVYDEESLEDRVAIYVEGYCAWSLETCCRASGYSNGTDLFEVNTRELRLKMEAFSREPGLQFEEHYIYDHGNCLADDCENITVYWWDRDEFPKYEDYLAEHEGTPSEREFDDNNDEIFVGGFEDAWGVWNI